MSHSFPTRRSSVLFNIERLSDDRYRITLAVAGFRTEDIDIVAQQNLLQITGRKDEEGEQDRSNFLHMGIANRGFERRFELADFVRVEKADLKNGRASGWERVC